jgi:hypothetical protein
MKARVRPAARASIPSLTSRSWECASSASRGAARPVGPLEVLDAVNQKASKRSVNRREAGTVFFAAQAAEGSFGGGTVARCSFALVILSFRFPDRQNVVLDFIGRSRVIASTPSGR